MWMVVIKKGFDQPTEDPSINGYIPPSGLQTVSLHIQLQGNSGRDGSSFVSHLRGSKRWATLEAALNGTFREREPTEEVGKNIHPRDTISLSSGQEPPLQIASSCRSRACNQLNSTPPPRVTTHTPSHFLRTKKGHPSPRPQFGSGQL